MKKKILVTLSVIACALLLVVGSVAGTLAYLTATASVENTFTVGQVKITLLESKLNDDGKTVDAGTKVSTNEYHLLPSETYQKDPAVTVLANSEACYVFIKVDNQIASVVDVTKIASQLTANNWVVFDSANGVYAYSVAGNAIVEKDANDQKLPIIESITVLETADNDALKAVDGKNIVITAYAIQASGLTQDQAWEALNP